MSDEAIQQEQRAVAEPEHPVSPELLEKIAEMVKSMPELAPNLDAVAETEKGSQTIAEIAEQLVPESKPEMEETQIVGTVSVGSLPGFWNLHVRYVNDAGGISDAVLQFGAHTGREVLPLWKSKNDFVAARKSDYKGILLVPCPEIVSV